MLSTSFQESESTVSFENEAILGSLRKFEKFLPYKIYELLGDGLWTIYIEYCLL